MIGWGYYKVYDAARSNPVAEAFFSPATRTLFIAALGGDSCSETTIIQIPYDGPKVEDKTISADAIGSLLKERFATSYVVFHMIGEGDWL